MSQKIKIKIEKKRREKKKKNGKKKQKIEKFKKKRKKNPKKWIKINLKNKKKNKREKKWKKKENELKNISEFGKYFLGLKWRQPGAMWLSKISNEFCNNIEINNRLLWC